MDNTFTRGGDNMDRKVNLKIKSLIALKGINQDVVARDIGISPTAFSRKINGLNEFIESEMEKLSLYFKCSPMDIFFSHLVDNWTTKTAS
jgi:DNA-binding Xre family transcriptional regulator